jgi:hypothetical protein
MFDFRCDPAMLCHSLEGKKRQHPLSSTTLSPVSRYVSLSFFLFSHSEGGEEAMGGCERGHRFTQGQLPPLRIHDVTTEEAKWGWGGGTPMVPPLHMFTHHPNSSHDALATPWDMATISKIGPRNIVGLQQVRVLTQNPPVGSVPPRVNRAKDKVTQRVASSWCIRGPIEGTRHPQPFYLSPSREVSFMPLRVGWHLAFWPAFDLGGQ